MKKYPKLVQCDSRGQIVIPKEVRHMLEIDEGTGFFLFTIQEEGILLKKVPEPALDESPVVKELEEKAGIIGLKRSNVTDSLESYKKKGGMQRI